MKTSKKDSTIVNSTDLMLPFSGEAIGAAEREYRYEPPTYEQAQCFQ